jgi:hypothetical protein
VEAVRRAAHTTPAVLLLLGSLIDCGPRPELVVLESASINEYNYSCIQITATSPAAFWRAAENFIAAQTRRSRPSGAIEWLIVRDKAHCAKLVSYSWNVPGELLNEDLYWARRAILRSDPAEAARLLVSGNGASVIRVSAGKARPESIGRDPRDLVTGRIRCRLLSLYGGGETEIPGVVWTNAFISCNHSDLRHEEGKALLEQIRAVTGIGGPYQSRLSAMVNTCHWFPVADFPVHYVFAEETENPDCPPGEITHISSMDGRICVPTDVERSECNY